MAKHMTVALGPAGHDEPPRGYHTPAPGSADTRAAPRGPAPLVTITDALERTITSPGTVEEQIARTDALARNNVRVMRPVLILAGVGLVCVTAVIVTFLLRAPIHQFGQFALIGLGAAAGGALTTMARFFFGRKSGR